MIVVLVIVGAGGFYAGKTYAENKRPTLSRQFGNGQGGRNGNNRNGFRPVTGEIISSDDKSITVKLQDGSSKIVILSGKTEVNKASVAGRDELKTGEKVAVYGSDNSDGSVTAQNIQLNPIFRGMQGSPQPK